MSEPMTNKELEILVMDFLTKNNISVHTCGCCYGATFESLDSGALFSADDLNVKKEPND